METKTLHIIALSNGTELDNLRLNGDNYICDLSPASLRELLSGNLRPVIIDDEEHEEMEIVHITHYENDQETWFTLRDMPESKKTERKIRSDIDYIAMMTDTNLEES